MLQIPEEFDVTGAMKEKCNSVNGPISSIPHKRRLWSSRMKKHVENRAIARAYKLGKGRDCKAIT